MSSAVMSVSFLTGRSAAHGAVPELLELVEASIGPGLDVGVTRGTGASDAQEGAGEGVVDRALEAGGLHDAGVFFEFAGLLVVERFPSDSRLAGSRPGAGSRRQPDAEESAPGWGTRCCRPRGDRRRGWRYSRCGRR